MSGAITFKSHLQNDLNHLNKVHFAFHCMSGIDNIDVQVSGPIKAHKSIIYHFYVSVSPICLQSVFLAISVAVLHSGGSLHCCSVWHQYSSKNWIKPNLSGYDPKGRQQHSVNSSPV